MKTLRRLAIFVLLVMPPAFSSGRVAAAGEPVIAGTEQILLLVGRSAVIHTDRAIQRVSLSTPEIADALVTAPREMLVHGKAPGTISLLVWADNGRITNYEVIVRRDLSPLEGQIRRQFPNEPIAVAVNGKDVVLSGVVSAKYVIDRAKALAAGYVDKPENIVSMLRQQESTATDQVMLSVRFAEVNRSAMQELGVNFFGGPTGADGWMGRSSTQQQPAPVYDNEKKAWIVPDFLNLFAFNAKEQIGATVKALKGRGLFESLAEPNLITQDGKEASFLAGGEFPYPVVQGGGANSSVTIVFKEFGVRLRFTPTITGGGYVHLKVAPEVSTLDFANAVVLEGFRVPALADAPHRDGSRAARRPDVRDFRIARSQHERNASPRARHRRHSDSRLPVPKPGVPEEQHRARRDDHAAHRAPRLTRRDAESARAGGTVPARADQDHPDAAAGILGPRTEQPRGAGSPGCRAMARPRLRRSLQAQAPTSAPQNLDEPRRYSRRQRQLIPGMTDANRKAAERAQKEIARLEREQAERDRKLAAIEAARATEEEKKQKKELDEARRIDSAREAREKKLEEKRLEEQAAIDRKRWLEQQEQAAKAKVVADKLAKEQARRDAEQARIENARLEEERRIAEKHQKAQDKLNRENEELEKLITQYKRLTGGQQ